MALFESFRLGVRQRSLQRILDKAPHAPKKRMNLDSAASVGILFDGTDPARQQSVADYYDTLRLKQGKKVQLLGFVDSEQEDGSLPFPSFSRKQLDWAFRPQGRAVELFLQTPFDLLILLHTTPHPVLEYVAAQATASLKVGPVAGETRIFDLMIDHPDASIPTFVREMEALLKKTNA